METGNEATVKLQVAAVQTADMGKGIARLNLDALQQLGLRQGSIIEIIGKRSTAVIALPPYAEDSGLNIIRLDGLERQCQVSTGDYVEIRPADMRRLGFTIGPNGDGGAPDGTIRITQPAREER